MQAKTTHSGRRIYKFFLIDNVGVQHLAATGEETADAHYVYTTMPEFAHYGSLDGHTRKNLQLW
jgi:hypothetical protein